MTFSDWEKTAVSEYTGEFSSDGIRDVYTTPSGIKVYHEVIIPRSLFKKQSERTMVDIIFPADKEKDLKEQGVSELDVDRYTEEGFGYPIFRGENSLEKAYNFIESLSKPKEVQNKNAHRTIWELKAKGE